jgi:aspartate aminotransferase
LIAALIYANRTLGFVNAPALMQRVVSRLTAEAAGATVYRKRRDAFMRVLDGTGIGYAKPEGAFYIFAQVPPQNGATDDAAFSACLKRRLVLGVPGSAFGAPGWIRFAYCVAESRILASAPAFMEAVSDWNGAS